MRAWYQGSALAGVGVLAAHGFHGVEHAICLIVAALLILPGAASAFHGILFWKRKTCNHTSPETK
jgi:hypothetical protein